MLPLPVSVLFNEPKLLKYENGGVNNAPQRGFSALQRAEIAEIVRPVRL